MTPVQAVVMVAIFEFLGPLLGGKPNTIGKFINLRMSLKCFRSRWCCVGSLELSSGTC